MPATPQEGAGTDPRSVTRLKLESFCIDAHTWTDGQVTITLTFATQPARYRIVLSLSEFLALDIEINKVIVELLKQRTV